MEIDIKGKSVEELKALAYDLILNRSNIENALMVVQKEIEYRQKQKVEEKPE